MVTSRALTTRDRHGHPVSEVRWTAEGALESAWARIPDGSWLGLEPRATTDAPWGLSDRLWHAAHPPEGGAGWPGTSLTVFEALDWAHLDHIPPGFEPARVPPGGGPTVLNLIAQVARAQGAERLVYRGPYPTEALFLGLLESFRYAPADAADPLATFMAGGLAWSPAPHEPLFAADGLYVQLRGRIEKVVHRGVAYYRPDWQGVARHTPRRVRDTPAGVVCSLWALGRPLEDHLLLAADGALLRVLDTAPVEDAVSRPLPPEVRAGVAAVVAAGSAPALAPFIRSAAGACALEWGAVSRDLVALGAEGIRISERLRRALAEALAIAPDRAGRAAIALATLVEIAALIGDALRGRAQAALATLPLEAQAAALERTGEAGDARGAREIVGATAALMADPAA